MVITTKVPEKMKTESAVAEVAIKKDTEKRSLTEKSFVFIAIAVAFCLIGYDSTMDTSAFRCHYETGGVNVFLTDGQCTESYLSVFIGVFIGIISLVGNYSIVITAFARIVQICGAVWLKFLLEKYRYFAHASLSIGYFGYAILLGVILADIMSIPKKPVKAQLFYVIFLAVITLATLITEYCFSVYWVWTKTGFTILGLTIFITSLCIFIISSLKPESAREDGVHAWPSVCIIGLCLLLVILIPSCHFALYSHQVSVVTVGTLVYVIRWWIPIFNKVEKTVSAPTSV